MSRVPFCIFILFSVRLSWLFAEQVSLAFTANFGTIHWHCGNVLETTLDAAFQIYTIRTSKHPTLSNPIELSSCSSNSTRVCCYFEWLHARRLGMLQCGTPISDFPLIMYIFEFIRIYVCIFCTCIYIYTAVYLSLSLYIYIYVHTCVYIYTYIYICTCAKGSPTKFWRNEATFWPETYEDQSAGFTSFSL